MDIIGVILVYIKNDDFDSSTIVYEHYFMLIIVYNYIIVINTTDLT